MDKREKPLRYMKPSLVDLRAKTRMRGIGQAPCQNGSGATGSCSIGTSALVSCNDGNIPDTLPCGAGTGG